MSEIDPMVQELMDTYDHESDLYRRTKTTGEVLTERWHNIRHRRDGISRAITARLAAAQPSREDIRYAIAGALHPDNLPPRSFSASPIG